MKSSSRSVGKLLAWRKHDPGKCPQPLQGCGLGGETEHLAHLVLFSSFSELHRYRYGAGREVG